MTQPSHGAKRTGTNLQRCQGARNVIRPQAVEAKINPTKVSCARQMIMVRSTHSLMTGVWRARMPIPVYLMFRLVH
jgi:hypothetical protein